jgi:hypothetical protein
MSVPVSYSAAPITYLPGLIDRLSGGLKFSAQLKKYLGIFCFDGLRKKCEQSVWQTKPEVDIFVKNK